MNKVVLLAPTPPPASGIASWANRMLKCGLGDNWEVSIVDEKVIGNRGVFKGSKRNLFDEYRRTKKIWKELKVKLKDPDVKIVQSCIAPSTLGMMREYVCMMMAKKTGKKYIIHYHSTLPNYISKGLNQYVFEKLSKAADMVFVLNKPSAKMMEKVVGKKYKIIYNFIENSAIRSCKKTINNQIETATYIGGVTQAKGCDVIIKTARELPNINFRLIGEISDSFDLDNIPSNVILTGPKSHEEVNKELERADVFLFLSRFKGEGFSIALLEAMASGLPCIVTDWAANADMIIDGECGVVISERSVHFVKEALMKIKESSARMSMSQYCVKRTKELYSQDIIIGQLLEAYEEI